VSLPVNPPAKRSPLDLIAGKKKAAPRAAPAAATAPPEPVTKKRALEDDIQPEPQPPAAVPVPVPVPVPPLSKKAKTGTAAAAAAAPAQQPKTKKRREVQDPSAVFLTDPSTSQRGVLVFDSKTAPVVKPTDVLPLRDEQNSRTLTLKEDQHPWLDTLTVPTHGAAGREQPLIALLGTTPMARSVPMAETLLMLHKQFNDRSAKMLELRRAQSLSTGLDQASGSVRLASGLPAVPPDKDTENAERDNRTPPLVGLPATTLAKTRQTWLPGGQLVTNHGFAYDNTRGSLLYVTSAFNKDNAEQYERFFERDRAEAAPPSVFGDAPPRPEDWAMYRKLREEEGERFRNHDKYLSGAGEHMPRVNPPVELPKAYIRRFMFPPRAELNEAACPNRYQCKFFTIAIQRGSQTAYTGMSLLLPDELAEFERSGKLPSPLPLCYFCELYYYKESMYSTLASTRTAQHTINRFTVCCEKGEFDVRDMIPNIVNDTICTGITGYVPQYRESMYQFVTAVRPDDPGGLTHGKKIRILSDLSLNF
jgi:hypothetical protein